MPRTQPPLEDVTRPELALEPGQFVVSAEHASNRIPAGYKNLGLTRRQLQAHIAWDPGTKEIARACARALGCPCHLGRYSRLLVDLNRSLHHPKLMASRSFSIAIPGNQHITPEERRRRIERYHAPYRESVRGDIESILARARQCVHLSMHSFTPVVEGAVRSADIGILYDPRSPLESALARPIVARLRRQGFHVRRNYPYKGISDGLATHFRRSFAGSQYAGLEIEFNQALLLDPRRVQGLARRFAETIRTLAESLPEA